MLDRQKRRLVVTSRTYHRDKFTARVFVDGRYFEVDRRGLEQLQAGASPDDLWSIEEVDLDDVDE